MAIGEVIELGPERERHLYDEMFAKAGDTDDDTLVEVSMRLLLHAIAQERSRGGSGGQLNTLLTIKAFVTELLARGYLHEFGCALAAIYPDEGARDG